MKMIDNGLVYWIKDLFADFSDLRFSWIDKATSRVVSKVGFMILKGDEGFSFGSSKVNIYLRIILRGRAGYEMIYNQLGATRLVGYDHFISSKPE